jgi:hypothetical protein
MEEQEKSLHNQKEFYRWEQLLGKRSNTVSQDVTILVLLGRMYDIEL